MAGINNPGYLKKTKANASKNENFHRKTPNSSYNLMKNKRKRVRGKGHAKEKEEREHVVEEGTGTRSKERPHFCIDAVGKDEETTPGSTNTREETFEEHPAI